MAKNFNNIGPSRDRLIALPANIRLGWNCINVTNKPAQYIKTNIGAIKKIYLLGATTLGIMTFNIKAVCIM